MKNIAFIVLLGLLFINTTHGQKYFGKSYTPTQNVDEYYDITDVEKEYIVMGKTELAQGFRSLEKTQQKIINLAKNKGADGVIFSIEEVIYGTSNSSGGSINEKKKKKKKKTTVSSTSNTIDLKEKKIKATFIKYGT